MNDNFTGDNYIQKIIKDKEIMSIEDYSNMFNNYIRKDEDLFYSELKYDLRDEISSLDISQDLKYICNLFLLYCNTKNIDPKIIYNYLQDKNITPLDFLQNNPGFLRWLKAFNNIRGLIQEKLINNGINLNDNNLIELYKGGYDTIVSSNSKIVSPYASTMFHDNSIIYKDENGLYVIYENGQREEIQPNSPILINNYYSLKELLYLLNVLAESDSIVYLTQSGLQGSKNRIHDLKILKEIICLIGNEKNAILDFKSNEENGIYSDSFTLNMKKIKQFIDIDSLLSYDESQYLGRSKRL